MMRRPLNELCLYAIAEEVISSRLLANAKDKKKLSQVANSGRVREYCGEPPSASMIHYVEVALRNLRYLVRGVRSPKQDLLKLPSSDIAAHIARAVFVDAIKLVDFLDFIHSLHEGERVWLEFLVKHLDQALNPGLAPSLALAFVTEYARAAEQSALNLINQDVTGFTRSNTKQIHVKVNVTISKQYPTSMKAVENLKEVVKQISNVRGELEAMMKHRSATRAAKIMDRVKKLTGDLHDRYLYSRGSREELLKSIMMLAITRGIHTALANIVIEEVVSDVLRHWNDMEGECLEARCAKLARRVRNKRWRGKVLSSAISKFGEAVRGLGSTSLTEHLLRWADEATRRGYISIALTRSYVRSDECVATVTVKVRVPVEVKP